MLNALMQKYNSVNAFGRMIGLELTVIAPGEVLYTMTITEDHLSNPLAAHGGAVAAMMDGVLGVAALSLSTESNRLVSTVEFKINYYGPVLLGDELKGHGKVVFEGNRIISSEGSIACTNRENVLLCKGLGTFNSYPASKNPLFAASAV